MLFKTIFLVSVPGGEGAAMVTPFFPRYEESGDKEEGPEEDERIS